MSDKNKKKDGSLEAIFEGQEDGELVEVDETGNVFHEGQAQQSPGHAPNILGDPRGEY